MFRFGATCRASAFVGWSRNNGCICLGSRNSRVTMHERARSPTGITTTFDKLESLLPAHIEVGAVRYLDYQTERVDLSNMFDYVMHKRHFYKYESEVRAVASAELGFDAARDHILANQVEGSYAPPVNVKAMVDEVVIHPEPNPVGILALPQSAS